MFSDNQFKSCRAGKAIALLLISVAASALPTAISIGDAAPTPIAEIRRDAPVVFESDVLPILRRNCLACHNATKAEADLVLETSKAILAGSGDGPVVVPGNSAKSRLLTLAAFADEPLMPPMGNKSGATKLTAEELGLIKLWIDQGAKSDPSLAAKAIEWRPLPLSFNPIYAAAVSPHGNYAVAGRGNRISVYHVPRKQLVAQLVDPSLPNQGNATTAAAHLDVVQSLAFSPNGLRLASGGYRTVKIWRRPQPVQKQPLAGIEAEITALATSKDARWIAVGQQNGKIQLVDANTAKVVHSLNGHTAAVRGLSFSADGSRLASGSADQTLRVWSMANIKQIVLIKTPSPVTAVAFVAGDQQVVTGGEDGVIRTWPAVPQEAEAEDGSGADELEAKEDQKPADAAATPIRELKGHSGPVTALVALGDQQSQLLSGGQDSSVRHWQVSNGRQIRQMNHGGPVTAVAVRSDGQRFASASDNKTAKLWNAGNGQQIAEMRGDFRTRLAVDDTSRHVELSKKRVANSKADLEAAKKRKQQEEENAKKVAEQLTKATEELKEKTEAAKKPLADKDAADKALEASKAEFTKAETDKQQADTAAETAAQQGNQVREKQTAANSAVTETEKLANDAKAKLAQAKQARDQKPDDAALVAAFAAAEKAVSDTEAKRVAAATARDAVNTEAAAAAKKKSEVDKARQQAGQTFTQLQNKVRKAEQAAKNTAAPAQKAKQEMDAAQRQVDSATRAGPRAKERVAQATKDITTCEQSQKAEEDQLKTFEAALEPAKQAVTQSEQAFRAIAFSPDGAQLATAGAGGRIYMWSGETGAPLDSCDGPENVTALEFLDSKSLVVAGPGQSLGVWDTLPAWQLERTIGNVESPAELVDRVTALAFSPDGRHLATGSGQASRSGQLKIWDVESGQAVRDIPDAHSDTILGMEFSHDGLQIASGGADRFVKVFTVADGTLVRGFEGHTHHVLGVSWRADGRLLASCSADNSIKVWNSVTGTQQKTIGGFKKELTSIQFMGIGDNMVVGGGDKTVTTRTSNGGGGPSFGGAGDFVYCVRASVDGKTVVAGGQDGVLRIWDSKGTAIASFDPPKPPADKSDGDLSQKQ